jgi:uncharacterized protein involved in type VI secretion and phage assembly
MDAITDLLSGVERHTDRFFGKFRGRVRDNDDPLKLGRIRASVPQILQDQDTGWALPALPYSGQGVGVYTIPAIDAGVWIEFEAGDVSQPIWSGCWWSDGQLPVDESGTGQTPDMKIIRTEKGLLLALDDGGETIAVSDSNGNNIMKIRVQDGRITIQAAQKVVVEAPQIELVENATHPLVFGDNLLTYLNQLVQMFNSHMHPGQLAAGVIPVTPAPPVPFFPPAQPSLLSTRVKTG